MKNLMIALILILASCSNSSNDDSVELTISAASSLADVLEEIKIIYTKEKPYVTLTLNMGPTGQLQQQIEQGAPTDVFISAAQKQMNELEEKEFIIKDTRVDVLRNELVLIAPTNSTLSSFNDLTFDKVKHIGIGNPESVPAGHYAKLVLEEMNLWEQLTQKFVEGQNVRTVLSFVETENAEAGFVYSSDTVVSNNVKVVATAPSDVAILYPAAVVKDSKNKNEAREFVEFLQSEKATELFEQFGFKKIY